MSAAGAAGPPTGDTSELLRAARILAIRSRREASGLFAGSYASAFRGGGMEFDESRPYVPGDDVRNMDWNAMARTGEAFVKHFREERDRVLVLALDVSASMAFGTTGRSKAMLAGQTAALLAAAAGRAGDRVGLVGFADGIRERIAPGRGSTHTWKVIRAAMACTQQPGGGTRLDTGVDAIRELGGRGAVIALLSDFLWDEPEDERPPGMQELTTLARFGELLSIAVYDPREEALPRAGHLRLEDSERPGRPLLLDSNRAEVRQRYNARWLEHRARLERRLRGAGSDLLWLRGDRDPLRSLMRFFAQRASRAPRARS
jgi:uncharacterized protein (DUF58 family)